MKKTTTDILTAGTELLREIDSVVRDAENTILKKKINRLIKSAYYSLDDYTPGDLQAWVMDIIGEEEYVNRLLLSCNLTECDECHGRLTEYHNLGGWYAYSSPVVTDTKNNTDALEYEYQMGIKVRPCVPKYAKLIGH